MFTGIVEEVGTVAALDRNGDSARLAVRCSTVLDGTRVGDSINVSGCCLTVTSMDAGQFTADVMGETVRRTALARLDVGAGVNLERAMPADGRFGGHLVQGHVDGVGQVVAVEPQNPGTPWTLVRIALPEGLDGYVVEKGSITVDGVSLTVVSVEGGAFTVGLIPHTLKATTLQDLHPGERVNLEVDIIAKYVAANLRQEGSA